MYDSTYSYEMTVHPLGRKPAVEYSHNGHIWIEGREGNNYTINLKNNSHKRALFVVSVDGLSIIAGKPAGKDSKGYILEARSSYNLVMYTPSHMTRGVATEIVQTWEPIYEEPNIVLVVGVPSIKVTIGKDGTIKAEGEQIPWGPIERLKNEMRSKNFFVGVAWDVTYPFVKIGCSTFSREDIVKIWETFAKLNNKNK